MTPTKRPMTRAQSIFIWGLLVASMLGPAVFKSKPVEQTKSFGVIRLLPTSFSGWTFTPAGNGINPLKGTMINELFEGFYTHPKFGRILLTVEYSSDARRRFQLHLPDVCHRVRKDRVLLHPSQTFYPTDNLPLQTAFLEWSYEPRDVHALCTYWLILGDTPTISKFKITLEQLLAGISIRPKQHALIRLDVYLEEIPDAAMRQQGRITMEQFVRDLYEFLTPSGRIELFGF